MADFEKAAMNAALFVYPNTKIQGCFFHHGQSIWRQIQNIGLSNKYSTDPEFSLNIWKILALTYFPDNLVEGSFENILQTEFSKNNEELLSNFIIYFDHTYIGRVNRKGQKTSPLFPIAIWNCYFLIEKDIPRTNNAVEGWHVLLAEMTHDDITPAPNLPHPNYHDQFTAMYLRDARLTGLYAVP
eukprot:XP_008180748.1 PREDICTED: uncharacterized protein LOC103308697 [Acyrthosiphon pisum]